VRFHKYRKYQPGWDVVGTIRHLPLVVLLVSERFADETSALTN
jgi:hypothetical protein